MTGNGRTRGRAKQRDQARTESTVGSNPFKLLHLEDSEPPPRQIRQATDGNGTGCTSSVDHIFGTWKAYICAVRVLRARKAERRNLKPSSDSEHSHTETPVSAEAEADWDSPARTPVKHASSGHEASLGSRCTREDGGVSRRRASTERDELTERTERRMRAGLGVRAAPSMMGTAYAGAMYMEMTMRTYYPYILLATAVVYTVLESASALTDGRSRSLGSPMAEQGETYRLDLDLRGIYSLPSHDWWQHAFRPQRSLVGSSGRTRQWTRPPSLPSNIPSDLAPSLPSAIPSTVHRSRSLAWLASTPFRSPQPSSKIVMVETGAASASATSGVSGRADGARQADGAVRADGLKGRSAGHGRRPDGAAPAPERRPAGVDSSGCGRNLRFPNGALAVQCA